MKDMEEKKKSLSAWDAGAVTNMESTFADCSSLTSLDVSAWDTSAVTNMWNTFSGCSSLKTLDVSAWDVGAVTNMANMFWGCYKLQSLDVSGWDTSSATNLSNIFGVCNVLTNVIFGEGWGKQTSTAANALTLDMTPVGSSKSYKLTDATWASMLTMYDRKTAGLADMTIKLSTKHNVPSGWEEAMTARGYIITKV